MIRSEGGSAFVVVTVAAVVDVVAAAVVAFLPVEAVVVIAEVNVSVCASEGLRSAGCGELAVSKHTKKRKEKKQNK